jgi:hypothetical protein
MQKLDKIKEVKVAEQSIEVQENLRCQLAVRKECYQRKKETLKRTNYVVIGN